MRRFFFWLCALTAFPALALSQSRESNDTSTSVERARRELARVEAASGAEGLATAEALEVLVSALLSTGSEREDETLQLAERALRLKESHMPPDDLGLVQSVQNLADVLKWRGDWNGAKEKYERALRIRTASQGTSHPDLANPLDGLGIVLKQMGQYEAAWQRFAESLEIRRTAFGDDDVRVARSWHLLGMALHDLGRLAESVQAYENALDLRQRFLPPDHPDLGWTLSNLGIVYQSMRKYHKARFFFEEALAVYEASGAQLKTAETLNNLGGLLILMGDTETARQHCEKALAIRIDELGEGSPFVGSSRAQLAGVAREEANYPEALHLYDDVEKNWREVYGDNHPKVAYCLRAKGTLFDLMGDDAEAEKYLKESLSILEGQQPPDQMRIAIGLGWLATHYARVGKHDPAIAALRRALRIHETVESSPMDLAWARIDLAYALGRAGQEVEARSLFDLGLKNLENVIGPNHFEMARSRHVYAQFLASQGQLEQARENLERVAQIYSDTFGSQHPLRAPVLEELADLAWRGGDLAEAFGLALKAEGIAREHAVLTAQGFPEDRALGYAAFRSSGLDMVLALAVGAASGIDGAAAAAWDALIRSRALVLDEVARRHLRFDGAQPEVAQLAAKFKNARQRLANLSVRGPGDLSSEDYRALLEETQRERQSLEEQLARLNVPYEGGGSKRNIGLADIRQSLPEGSALLAYATWDRPRSIVEPDPAAQGETRGPDRFYLAFVLNTKGEIALVPLGRAQDIDAAVKAWREEMTPRGLAAGDSRCRLAGEVLRQLVWDPVVAVAGEAQRFYVVPDGAMSLVPIAALPKGEGFVVEENFLLHYLTTERDLVPSETAARGRGLLALGGCDYDARRALSLPVEDELPEHAGPLAARSGSREGGSGSLEVALAYRGASPPCPSFANLPFQPLPFAEREVREVASLSEGALGGGTTLLLGAEAAEGAFKRQAPGKRFLHLATHGFFLGSECVERAAGTRGTGGLVLASTAPPATLQENPLLRAGLVLAGANQRSTAGPDEEDGILTAEEIAFMDLSTVEWAVLSACDTGLGEVVESEGIFGLRRAFRIAGARTLVMSLWPVHDEATRVWMQAAYELRLQQGAPTDEAIHHATRTTLEWCRKEKHTDHPVLWAGFIAVGTRNEGDQGATKNRREKE